MVKAAATARALHGEMTNEELDKSLMHMDKIEYVFQLFMTTIERTEDNRQPMRRILNRVGESWTDDRKKLTLFYHLSASGYFVSPVALNLHVFFKQLRVSRYPACLLLLFHARLVLMGHSLVRSLVPLTPELVER